MHLSYIINNICSLSIVERAIIYVLRFSILLSFACRHSSKNVVVRVARNGWDDYYQTSCIYIYVLMIGAVKYDDVDRLKAFKTLPFRNVTNEVSSHIFCRRFRMSFSTNSRTQIRSLCAIYFYSFFIFSARMRKKENICCITRRCYGAI